MRATVLISMFFVAVGGCLGNNKFVKVHRNNVSTGMTLTEIWELYGYNAENENDLDSVPPFANNPISEKQIGPCTILTYRHWLVENNAKRPFLLSFKSCRLPNYEAVQREKSRRIDRMKDAVKNDAEFKNEVDVFCEENELDSQDREILIELLAAELGPLAKCMTDLELVEIQLDENRVLYGQSMSQRRKRALRDQLNYQQNRRQLEEIQWQLDEMEHKASFDRMMRGGLP